MMEQLLDTTAIWALGLLLFDLLLRRENYHAYNRAYLLSTFLMGIFLPFMQWHTVSNSQAISTVYQPVVRQVATVRNIIIASAQPATESVTVENVLLIIYAIGALCMLGLQLRDIFKLVTLYRKGRKSKESNFTVIETGKDHTPFSFLNLVFVSDKSNYTVSEWDMILRHELRHRQMLHIIDITLMQLAKVIFWFHPLVYVFNKRLLLVHEYQADSIIHTTPAVYGQFLITQSLLHAAPVCTHSFHCSPIRNRILMLTQRSTKASKFKTLVIVPVLLVFVACFTKANNGNNITFKGNNFEFSPIKFDTISIQNPVTGKWIQKIDTIHGKPIKMNGKEIYDDSVVDTKPGNKISIIDSYLCYPIINEHEKYAVGSYLIRLSNIVIGPDGSLVYYEFDGIKYYSDMDHPTEGYSKEYLPTDNNFYVNFKQLLEKCPKMKPYKIDGVAVPCLLEHVGDIGINIWPKDKYNDKK